MKPSSGQEKDLRIAIADKLGMDHRVAVAADIDEYANLVYSRAREAECCGADEALCERAALRDEVAYLRSILREIISRAQDGKPAGHFCIARDALQSCEGKAKHALRFPDL